MISNKYTDNIETQVLVVGSGAGGAITAATLAAAGYSVLIVEEGPEINTKNLATHSPEAMQLLYRNNGLSPILGNTNIAFVEGRCVGGSTEINSALWHRTPADAIARWINDFHVNALSLKEIDSLFSEIEAEVNISYYNSKDIPVNSSLLKIGAEKLGWCIEEVPRAQSNNLQLSQFDAGTKNSMSRTYIPKAIAAGGKLLPNCKITRLHYKNKRINSVSGIVTKNNQKTKVTINAEFIFLCSGATQTPLILLSSNIKRNIGNSLKIHPMLKVAALFDKTLNSHKAPLPIYQVREFYPNITLGGSIFTPGFLAILLSEDWNTNYTAIKNWKKMSMYYTACCGNGAGKIKIFPFTGEAMLLYKISKEDQINLSKGLAYLCELLFQSGAKALYPSLKYPTVIYPSDNYNTFIENPIPIENMSLSNVHAFSTCPMGEKKEICATDSFGKVYDFENLYISDASIIPDAPGVNPQGTVMALALRNAKHFLQE